MIGILAAGDVPNARSVIFGAVVVVVAGVVIGAIWKLLAYATKSTFKSALTEVFGDEFTEIRTRLDHLHECFERRVSAVEARDTAANVIEMRRIADAIVARMVPKRKTDPLGDDHLNERALPPSES